MWSSPTPTTRLERSADGEPEQRPADQRRRRNGYRGRRRQFVRAGQRARIIRRGNWRSRSVSTARCFPSPWAPAARSRLRPAARFPTIPTRPTRSCCMAESKSKWFYVANQGNNTNATVRKRHRWLHRRPDHKQLSPMARQPLHHRLRSAVPDRGSFQPVHLHRQLQRLHRDRQVARSRTQASCGRCPARRTQSVKLRVRRHGAWSSGRTS